MSPHRQPHIIYLYSKPGCQLCQAAKDKLDGMQRPYIARNILAYVNDHEGWREDGSVEIRAAWAYIDEKLPLLFVDGQPMTYPEAMRLLRGRKEEACQSSPKQKN